MAACGGAGADASDPTDPTTVSADPAITDPVKAAADAIATGTAAPPTTLPAPPTMPAATAPVQPKAPAPSHPPMVDGTLPPFAPTSVPAVAAPLPAGSGFADFDASLRQSLLGHGAMAASVAVAKDGRLVHVQAYGAADPFTGEPVRLSSTFRIASISKTITAIAVMRLAEQGVLSIDSPVLGALAASLGTPIGDPRMESVTVRHLLGHTSGFPEYERTFFGGLVDDCTAAGIRGLSRRLATEPGSTYNYANMNFCLLGLLVEQVTGRPYADVVDELVLRPLGINDMRMAGTFDFQDGDVLHPTTPTRKFMEALGAAGAWVGTPVDLVTIVDALDPAKPGPKLLTPASALQMHARPPVAFTKPDVWYGLGLIEWDNGTAWGHTGTLENARSMVVHRADGITWAVTVNGNYPAQADRIRGMVDKALGTVRWDG
jgi:D-alanyl-D-alanine carboxypeptidase